MYMLCICIQQNTIPTLQVDTTKSQPLDRSIEISSFVILSGQGRPGDMSS